MKRRSWPAAPLLDRWRESWSHSSKGWSPRGVGTAAQAVLAGSFAREMRYISWGLRNFFLIVSTIFMFLSFPQPLVCTEGRGGRDEPCAYPREQRGAAFPMLLLARQRVLLLGASELAPTTSPPHRSLGRAPAPKRAHRQRRVAGAGPQGAGAPWAGVAGCWSLGCCSPPALARAARVCYGRAGSRPALAGGQLCGYSMYSERRAKLVIAQRSFFWFYFHSDKGGGGREGSALRSQTAATNSSAVIY